MAARVVGAIERVYPGLADWWAEGGDLQDPWIEGVSDHHLTCYLYMQDVVGDDDG